jgi:hypothetical protein
MVRAAFMLARLDEPLRPIGAVKTAEAMTGETIVAIAPADEPRHACGARR